MGPPDYRETFTYAAEQLNAYGLAYLHLVDGLAFGFHELGQPMTLPEFRAVFDRLLMGCGGYTQETAAAAIASGQADLIAFGRPYLSNPDLVERFANGWELNPPAAMKVWSAPTAQGYTDFPFHPGSVLHTREPSKPCFAAFDRNDLPLQPELEVSTKYWTMPTAR